MADEVGEEGHVVGGSSRRVGTVEERHAGNVPVESGPVLDERLRVGNDETELVRGGVHPAEGFLSLRGAAAAVQVQHERHARRPAVSGWDVDDDDSRRRTIARSKGVDPDATACPHGPPSGAALVGEALVGEALVGGAVVVDEPPFAAGFPPPQAEVTAATATSAARTTVRCCSAYRRRPPATAR